MSEPNKYSRIYKGKKPSLEAKNPYLVKGGGNTIKYLTDKQADGREDLIPQFRK